MPFDERGERRESFDSLPKFKYPSMMELRIIARIAGQDFPPDKKRGSLPSFGLTDEQKESARSSAQMVLNDEGLLMNYLAEARKERAAAIETLNRILETD